MRSRVLAELVAVFAPPGCAACRTPLDDAREPLCRDCRRALPWLRGARCDRCGLPSPCAPCPAARAAFGSAWAPLAYAGVARDLVVALKFHGALALADLMAAHIAATAPSGLLDRTILIPVPAHPSHVRTRGFDQALLLARALGRRTKLPLDARLTRQGSAESQLGRTRRGRTRAGRIEFGARPGHTPEAVLVDDVHTTGATLHAAARALKRAGVEQVSAVTYARTLKA